MPETITLTQEQLQHYVHVGSQGLDDLPADDARVCRQIGLFFAANLDLANCAVDIEELVLTPRGDGESPLARLRIVRWRKTFLLESDGEGIVPLPGRKWRWTR